MHQIDVSDILQATDGGRTVILDYYPDARGTENGRKKFRIRTDDKNRSAHIWRNPTSGEWFLMDMGDAANRRRSIFDIVREEERLDGFGEAIRFLAAKYAPHLLRGGAAAAQPKPVITETEPHEETTVYKRKSGKFTARELDLLGYRITQEACTELRLFPVDYYVTAQKNGKSWRIAATESYPIYYYDYGGWGRLYQPLGGDRRFQFVGRKPADFIFGDQWVLRALDSSRNRGPLPGAYEEEAEEAAAEKPDAEGEEDEAFDDAPTAGRVEQCEAIILCSGGSDALNVRCACIATGRVGLHVAWLNSETAELSQSDMYHLRQISQAVYLLYDQDATGIARAEQLAMKYLDLRIVRLPDDLGRFRTRKGGVCKDAKDLFVHYRKPSAQDPYKVFGNMLRVSGSLKFWSSYTDRNGRTFFDINNEQLYAFLQARGYFRIESSATNKGFTFCRIDGHIVHLIDEQAIASECNTELLRYLTYDRPEYYSQSLANAIHRSNQVKLGSLEKLRMISPDFRYFGPDFDHVLFRNKVVRIDRDGIEEVDYGKWRYFEYASKILDHDIRVDKTRPFDIVETPAALAIREELSSLDARSEEYRRKRGELDAMTGTDRFELRINNPDFSFLRYVYNTGRVHWRKEEAGHPLTAGERAEHDLHFMSKVMALGYMLAKYKSASKAKAVYALEVDLVEEGQHKGGTGKSIFMRSVEQVRNQLFIDGQNVSPDKMEFLFQGVVKGVTDSIYFDDLNRSMPMSKFMTQVTAPMKVNAKYAAEVTLRYEDSPKLSFSSNHAINNFDDSIRRRIWFIGFSDYYHAERRAEGLTERNPCKEFGKNLIQDYTSEEMNEFYNFMLTCLHVFIKHQAVIQSPMENIEKRSIQREIGDDFIFWAEGYFMEEGRLDTYIDKAAIFEDYKASLSKRAQDSVKIDRFKAKLGKFCEYNGWTLNPDDMLTTAADRSRREFHRKVAGTHVYYYYIRTTEEPREQRIF